MISDFANGVTGLMAEAGAEVLLRPPYVGVAIDVGGAAPKVLDTASAIGCALARAFPAMLDKMEGGSRDTLLHPGPIGADDPAAWEAMSPAHRAQHVLHQAPGQLRGVAAMLARVRTGHPTHDAGLAFLCSSVTALAQQMERAAAVQCREQEQRRAVQEAEEARRRAAKPKRVRKPAKRKKGG